MMIVNISLWLAAVGLVVLTLALLRRGAHGRDDGEAAGVLRVW